MVGKLTLNMLTFTHENCKEMETLFKKQVTKGEVLLNCIQCSGDAARDPAKCLAKNPAVLKSVGAGAVDAAELDAGEKKLLGKNKQTKGLLR